MSEQLSFQVRNSIRDPFPVRSIWMKTTVKSLDGFRVGVASYVHPTNGKFLHMAEAEKALDCLE